MSSQDPELDQVILAIMHNQITNILGAAKFQGRKLEILSNQHSDEDHLKDIVTSLCLSIRPTNVLIASKSSSQLKCILESLCLVKDKMSDNEEHEEPNENEEVIILPFSLEIRPNNEFKFENGKKMLIELNVPDQTSTTIESMLNLESNKISCACAGAVLRFLAKDAFGLDGQIDQISLFSLECMMQLSIETIYSLSIFDESKTFPSLFKLLNLTKTGMGKEKMRSWFLAPLQSVSAIENRQEVVEFFTSSENVNLVDDIQQTLSKIFNIPKIIYRLRVKSVVNDWLSLYHFLLAYTQIHSLISKQPQSLRNQVEPATTSNPSFILFEHLSSSGLNTSLQEVAHLLSTQVDFAESTSCGRVVIAQFVDAQLDEMKRFYHGLESFLTAVASKLDLPLPEFQVVYMVSLGFLIKSALPVTEAHLNLLSFQFQSDEAAFFKNKDMLTLDLEIGDIHSQIIDRELAIVQDIREEVMNIAGDLLFAANLVAELDCLIAFAKSATMYRYVKPIMTESDCLLLENMRHPIMEHFEDRFVENDIGLGLYESQSLPKALIITGPNASGKSVYLHQVALIVYLAHLGSFVPCQYAVVGLTDKILTRMRTKTSLSLRESTFQSDLKQACASISQCTPKSLVLLDEFGKGTASSDGVGLFAASVSALCKRGTRLLAATHFHEVFSFPEFVKRQDISFFTMETMAVPGECPEFLYQIVPGRSKSSMGILCAANNGIKEPILQRAKSIAQSLETGCPIPLLAPKKRLEKKALVALRYFFKMDLCREDADLDQLLALLSAFDEEC